MSHPPIFREAWEHLRQAQPTHQETPMTVLHHLIADLEHDLNLTNSGVEIRDILARHLTLHNVTSHLADAAARLAQPPTGPLLESMLGLPPDAQAIVAEIAASLANRLTNHQVKPQPAADMPKRGGIEPSEGFGLMAQARAELADGQPA